MSEAILKLDAVERVYRQGDERLHVLRGASLSVAPGEIVALVGPSGSGKSTLLHLAGLLEKPDGGSVHFAGQDCGRLPDDRRTALRRDEIGFVYQFHHLLPEFSALENVVMPQMIAGKSRRDAKARAQGLLEQVGLAARVSHRPARLSGGEQQRVAIARALANAPKLLIADEPTGNLDERTSDEVFAMLIDMARRTGLSALIATHNPDLAQRMDRIVEMREGRVVARQSGEAAFTPAPSGAPARR